MTGEETRIIPVQLFLTTNVEKILLMGLLLNFRNTWSHEVCI